MSYLSTIKIFLGHVTVGLTTGLYLGKIRVAPGTWGSLLGLFLGLALLRYGDFFLFIGFTLLLTFLSIPLIVFYTRKVKRPIDAPEIVIDEVVGMLLSMTPLGMAYIEVVTDEGAYPVLLVSVLPEIAALGIGLVFFALFRFFDIVKPWPISWINDNMHSALGTVLDDVAAAICAALTYIALFYSGILGF